MLLYSSISRERGSAKKVVETMISEFSTIDILVNNAGICRINNVLDFDRTDWDPMVEVNLTTAFEMIHESAKYMIKQGSGKIINICLSVFVFRWPRFTGICCDKTWYRRAY